jgi:hypothetical protein
VRLGKKHPPYTKAVRTADLQTGRYARRSVHAPAPRAYMAHGIEYSFLGMEIIWDRDNMGTGEIDIE